MSPLALPMAGNTKKTYGFSMILRSLRNTVGSLQGPSREPPGRPGTHQGSSKEPPGTSRRLPKTPKDLPGTPRDSPQGPPRSPGDAQVAPRDPPGTSRRPPRSPGTSRAPPGDPPGTPQGPPGAVPAASQEQPIQEQRRRSCWSLQLAACSPQPAALRLARRNARSD